MRGCTASATKPCLRTPQGPAGRSALPFFAWRLADYGNGGMMKRTTTDTPSWQNRFRTWAGQWPLPAERSDGIVPVAVPDLLAVTVARVLAGLPRGALVLTAEHAAAETLQAALHVYLELLGDPRRPLLLPPAGNPDRRYWIPQNEAARSAALDAALREPEGIFIAAAGAALARPCRRAVMPPKS